MKGFKNTTKMVSGHNFAPIKKAGGGIVPSLGGGMPRMNALNMRPIISRPRVMPGIHTLPKMGGTRFAKGGATQNKLPAGHGGGGPYHSAGDPPTGSATEHRDRPYSQSMKEFPDRKELLPGYAVGGRKPIKMRVKKGALHRDMGIPQGQKIPISAIRRKLTRDKASSNTKGIKRDVFALNAKTKFNKAKGGLAFLREPAVGRCDK